MPSYQGFCTFEEYCDLNNIDENNITEEHVWAFYNKRFNNVSRPHDVYSSYILEMLNSHSANKFVELLNEILPDDCAAYTKDYVDDNSKDAAMIIIKVPYVNNLVSKQNIKKCVLKPSDISKKIETYMHYFNYYITYIDIVEKTYEIYIEPRKTVDASLDVLKSGNIVYHVTHKNNLSSILKKGLRPTVGNSPENGGYRYFPDRLFVIKHTENYLNDILEVLNIRKLHKGDYVIFKIHLKHHEIDFYTDSAMDNTNMLYTFEAIPPSLLQNYIFDINNEEFD